MRWSAFVCVSFLASCAQPTVPNCAPKSAGWLGPEDGYKELQLPHSLQITRSGDLRWNGSTVSSARVKQELRVVGGETVAPPIVGLTYETGVSCSQLETVRDMMSDTLHCERGQWEEGGWPAPPETSERQ